MDDGCVFPVTLIRKGCGMMNFPQRPALRGFRITERRTQASDNGHTVAGRTEVTDTAFHWPLRFPIAALLLFAAGAKVVNAPIVLAGDGLLASWSRDKSGRILRYAKSTMSLGVHIVASRSPKSNEMYPTWLVCRHFFG